MKHSLTCLSALLLAPLAMVSAVGTAKPNIVFICADDLNYDSVGCYGCKIPDLTPHIDRLAAEGMRFQYAYSTVAVCQPVRETMHCGRYPHRSGALGFYPLKPEIRTLNQQRRKSRRSPVSSKTCPRCAGKWRNTTPT